MGKKAKFHSNSQCEVISSEDELVLRAIERCEFKHSALGNFQRQSKRIEVSSDGSGEESSASDSSESTYSSGIAKKKFRRKVKSGAEVMKRPVVKTELWPHTIANEDDGENINSEDISLSKFLSCYTYIMINCVEPSEAEGRAVFLHAISTVLECLPWVEARAFHNIIMLKIEQDRINWSADFVALANQFLDKKVRMNLRLSHYSGRTSSSCLSNDSRQVQDWERSNFRYNNNSYFNRSNFIYYAICYQWNCGECSYGSECKRWHVCRSCAAEGKLGEQHKASSHDSSATNNGQGNQRF